MDLTSNCHVPILDDPISLKEVEEATASMKKGGSDFPLTILSLLFNCFKSQFVILFNLIFYLTYPINLTTSILTAIPKKGNLKIPNNY